MNTFLNLLGLALVMVMVGPIVALPGERPADRSLPTRPVFPTVFTAKVLFSTKETQGVHVPEVTVSVDLSRYPAWRARENYTLRGVPHSNFLDVR